MNFYCHVCGSQGELPSYDLERVKANVNDKGWKRYPWLFGTNLKRIICATCVARNQPLS